ncbi:hypothetical protein GCM10010404_92070 [Nonomuraea africana]
MPAARCGSMSNIWSSFARRAGAKAPATQTDQTDAPNSSPHPGPFDRADTDRPGGRYPRPPAFDKQLYKRRNVVERCFNRLKQWRGIATLHDKTAESYQAAVTLASLLTWADI